MLEPAAPKSGPDAATRAEQAFAFYAELPAKERRYSVVAERFGASLATIKLWASKGRWRRRVAERDARVVRRAVDKVETVEVDHRARYLKMVEVALIKLVNGIASGEVKGTFSDLDRLVRLKVYLEEPEVGAGGPQQIVVNLIRSGGPGDVATVVSADGAAPADVSAPEEPGDA
jgi:hypothetical protein